MNDEAPSVPVTDATDTSWCVMRQDDNGNAFMITRGLDRDAAQAIAADFEARGHKQLYWIRRQ